MGPRAAIRLFLLSFVFDCFYDLGGALRLVLEGAQLLGGPAHSIKEGPAPGPRTWTSEGDPALGGPRLAIRFFLLPFIFDCFYDLGGARAWS